MNDHPADRTVGVTSRLRLRGYDYSMSGAYFITCTAIDRRPLFGEVRNSGFTPSPLGLAILDEWEKLELAVPEVTLESCQLMPDHFHALLYITSNGTPKSPSLSSMIGRFKSLSARRYWQIRDAGLCESVGTTCWQDRFHDRIIRSDQQFQRVYEYMILNPRRWSQKHGE